jgi:hypothetical protein
MKVKFIFLILVIFPTLSLYSFWDNIRTSSVTQDDTIWFQYENPVEDISSQSILYYEDNEWVSVETENVSQQTHSAQIPFNNTYPLPISFHLDSGNGSILKVGYIEQDVSSTEQMILLRDYPRDLNIPAHLNIAAEYVVLDQERITFALVNHGGGFPLSDDLFGPFYSYTANLWTYGLDDPEYVFSLLLTVDFPPFISSGLYKIHAPTDDMELIAPIEYELDIENNTLLVSCFIVDLLADPDFSFAGPDDSFLTSGFITQKIEDLGQNVILMDTGLNHSLSLSPFVLEPFENSLPEISNVSFSENDNITTISVDYFDENGHFPLDHELILNNDTVVPFHASNFDFSGTVTYHCEFSEPWSEATISFSDNGFDFVTIPLINSVDEGNHLLPPFTYTIYPNPFMLKTDRSLSFRYDVKSAGLLTTTIYNIKGQKLSSDRREVSQSGNHEFSIPISDVLNSSLPANGILLVKVEHNQTSSVKKVVVVK